jgi:AcrR family transcriptional regulator
MARARANANEAEDSGTGTGTGTGTDGPRPGGRPRDAALDEAIILATRARLIRDGYSRMTIGDIAADAKVSRPTLYRRWGTKFELVVDALDYGFRRQRDMYTLDLSRLEPREALVEAVRRLDPAYFNPDAMVLMGNFAGEASRTPELLEILRKHAVEPRVALVETVLAELQDRGVVRAGIDRHTVATLCFGSYFAAFYRHESKAEIPEAVVAVLWPALAA